ncbi:hypothetical protein DP113_01290 [Brasilonema octagenarum UFV-E1]|uniref:Uncharacterized protein n=2 Tax=Brasilonema TaxID=383614 RepID=A0A856MCH4_9CYAN|nr:MULTISPECIES: hypothetical protein [Brasilonema]NMF65406.1 hypothetical protein [Brasilonema octagenarum UFV-OR1]QDL06727.1 hypothetical protein DP114_01300 [Brasilonema sennae CENA114]QDL13096.1 hypothetical protein DP113_01290 [Brasilonema octagenarum UFV-E1]
MAAKGKKEIKQELDKKKQEGDTASKKALELAKLAEKTKAVLEGMQGEATAEAAASMEGAAAAFQAKIDARYVEAEKQSEKIDTELKNNQQKFSEGVKADQADVQKLNNLKAEAQKARVSAENIKKAEKAKTDEIKFLNTESQAIEKSQQEMQKNINEAKQKRQSAQFTYQSKNTLGS